MSHQIFKDVLRTLADNTEGYRDKVRDGDIDLRNYGLTANELSVLSQCGVHCGHLDPKTHAPIKTPDPKDKDQKKFRDVLRKLSTNDAYRTRVKIGVVSLKDDAKLNPGQIRVLYQAGELCGHLV